VRYPDRNGNRTRATETIRELGGRQFDPEIVAAFEALGPDRLTTRPTPRPAPPSSGAARSS
jgi:response regulator RpfG family c-di-GMP phosphodiesterase